MKTKILLDIPKEVLMESHFNAVMHYLSFGVNVPKSKEKSKVTNGHLPFVKKALEYSVKHPQLIPGFDTLPSFQKDEQMVRDLKMFASDARESLGKITANQGSVDYVAFAYAEAFLENVKTATDKNLKISTKIYKELSKELPNRNVHAA